MCPVWSDIFCMYTWYILFETFSLGSNLRSIPSNPLLFLNLPHVWSRSISDESTMVVSRWFFQGWLHYSHWRLKHCKSWTLLMYGTFANICQPKLTIHDSCWTLSSTQEDGDGEAFGEWEIGCWTACKHRDFSKGTPQSMGILGTVCRTHTIPNRILDWEWYGSRYGWLGVPVFFWAPWNFLLKTWCVGV